MVVVELNRRGCGLIGGLVMDDLSHFCCLNPACEHCGKRGAGNLSVCDRYGKGRWRLLYCSGCKARFSERKGTVFFRSRLKSEKVVSILQHVNEGVGMRKTGRLEGVKEDTVIRYARLAGGHAKALHDELVCFSPGDPGSADGREVVVCQEEGEELRGGRGGRAVRRQLGPCRV
jgi:transposase-like protein